MTYAVVSVIVAAAAWLGWEVFHEAAAELIVRLLGPISRPIWRAFLATRWRVPLLFTAMPVGIAGVIKGYALLSSSPGRADLGMALFFGGAGFFLLTIILWSETKGAASTIRETAPRSPVKRA